MSKLGSTDSTVKIGVSNITWARESRDRPGIGWWPPRAPTTVVPLANAMLNFLVGGYKPRRRLVADSRIVEPSPAASARTRSWSTLATSGSMPEIALGLRSRYVSRRNPPSWNSCTCIRTSKLSTVRIMVLGNNSQFQEQSKPSQMGRTSKDPGRTQFDLRGEPGGGHLRAGSVKYVTVYESLRTQESRSGDVDHIGC